MIKTHCDICGAELDEPYDPGWREPALCGNSRCEREAREDDKEAREEAHKRLDEELGY